MRVVHLAAGAGSMYCGACARDALIARGLIRRGHDVTVMPLYTPLRVEGDGSLPTTSVYLGGVNAYLQHRFPLYRRAPRALTRWMDHPSLLRFASRFAVSTNPRDLGPLTVSTLRGADGPLGPEFERLIAFIEGFAQPDVVSITNSLLAAAAPVVRSRLGVPVVCSLQGEESFVGALPEPYRGEAMQLIRRNAASVDLFLSPGVAYRAMMREFLDVDEERITVVRPGVDTTAYTPSGNGPSMGPIIGHLSSILPAKGLALLVRAFRQLADSHGSAVRLRVAGRALDRRYAEGVWGAVRSDGLAERVEYLGELPTAKKAGFLRSCTLFCLPSLIAESRAQAALEALACGVPVVVPDAGVFPELIELTAGGLLFRQGDADSLAEALSRLLDDPDEARAMGRRGRLGVERYFCAERMVADVEAALAKASSAR